MNFFTIGVTQREKDNLIKQWLAYICDDFITFTTTKFENDKESVEFLISDVSNFIMLIG